jgi:hypothetical protein
MMRWWYIVLFFPVLVHGQVRVFKERMSPFLSQRDQLVEILQVKATSDDFCPLTDDYMTLENLAYSWMKLTSKNKRTKLVKSSFLQAIAHVSAETWANSYFYSNRTLKTPKKQIQRLLPKTNTKYGLIDCFAFSIPLIQSVPKRKLKYDYKQELGGLNLFLEKEITNDDGEKEVIRMPVQLRTQEEIMKVMVQQLKKNGISDNLRDGVYYATAIAIQPDARTFGKSRIPHARVFVVLGARRLHYIREQQIEN